MASTILEAWIRISLERVEPPAGRLGLVTDTQPASNAGSQEVSFTGWLGLLRALEELLRSTEAPA